MASSSRKNLVTALGLVVLAAVAVIASRELVDRGELCVINWQAMQPLVVGDTARYVVGRTSGNSCAPRLGRFEFSPLDTSKVDVTADGLIRAKHHGRFSVLAKRGDASYVVDGYVIPRVWEPRLAIRDEVIHVGDTIWVSAQVLDSTGSRIDGYRGSVSLQKSGGDERVIVETARSPWGGTRFIAVDTGVAVIVGEIKGRRVAEAVTVLPKR